MDGDDLTCIIGTGPSYPYDRTPSGEASCLGHVAHELGHVFGLQHTGDRTDCMQQGLYRATVPSPQECAFGPGNRATVQNTNGAWLNHA